MRAFLLGAAAPLAALALTASPAPAQHWSNPGFGAAAGVSVHRSAPNLHAAKYRGDRRRWHGSERRRHRRDRGYDEVFVGDWEWQGDSAWRSDIYNDWCHERTARSYPRWMQNNGNCERQWWGGGGWRC